MEVDIVLQNKQRLGLTDIVKPGGLLYFHVHEPRIKFKSWALHTIIYFR
jgi:ATP-dependent helicase/nuclease subunit B